MKGIDDAQKKKVLDQLQEIILELQCKGEVMIFFHIIYSMKEKLNLLNSLPQKECLICLFELEVILK